MTLIDRYDKHLVALMLFFLIPPYFLWNQISPLYFVIAASALNIRYINLNRASYIAVLIAVFLYVHVIIKAELNIYGALSILGFILVLVLDENHVKRVYDSFIKLTSLVLIPSIIAFVLDLNGINYLLSSIAPLNNFKQYGYDVYLFLVKPELNAYSVDSFLRYHGYFDEPGVVGTLSAVVLTLRKWKVDRLENIVFYIAGILSLSVAFYGAFIVYTIIFIRQKLNFRFVLVIVGIAVLMYAYSDFFGVIVNRLTVEDGRVVANNRLIEGYSIEYENYYNSIYWYTGLGKAAAERMNIGGSSYLDLVVAYGIIWFVVFAILWIYYSYIVLRKTEKIMAFLLILIIIIYQRPFVTEYLYMFLIIGSLKYLSSEK